jgi:hypothetical protein
MTSIVDMTKLPDAREAAEATARLYDVLCIAAEATATGALNAEGRLVLAVAVARGTRHWMGRVLYRRVSQLLAADTVTLSDDQRAALIAEISVRAAQVIGGPVADRVACRKQINDFYRIRSTATHGGKLR